MSTSFISGSCAVAVCLLVSSLAGAHQPQVNCLNGVSAVSLPVQDTVPRQAARPERRAAAGNASKSQSSTSQQNQRSDARGEGNKKGRRGINKGSADSTNSGAVNTPDTTRAQF